MVDCPACGKQVKEREINAHLDSGCQDHVDIDDTASGLKGTQNVASFFSTPVKRTDGIAVTKEEVKGVSEGPHGSFEESDKHADILTLNGSTKRKPEEVAGPSGVADPPQKRAKLSSRLQEVAPLADRMRPRTLDDVYGQELVGKSGVIRGLVEQDRVPSMVLWGGPGTGKTTIARLIAHSSNSRFVEINSTSTGVGECKKLFGQAMSELQLTGRKTIIFCDEIHRFSKSQQDVFLGPVEAGLITLIGATTENPSFKVISALLSRCRVFTLSPLTERDIVDILQRALTTEAESSQSPMPSLLASSDGGELLSYLATSASGDARTALNLLELAMSLSGREDMTLDKIKQSLTHTLVYDRQGDAHYDAISALHKSIRGSNPHASLYYLARMISSGEDPLYIARRLIVIASEDIGLADNTMLPLAIATHDAVQKVGLPEARINLGHCVTALALARKSTRAYRALSAAMAAAADPKMGGLPIPLHLRNAPTRLMKEVGYGKDYKYNPDYRDGRVKQSYLPGEMLDWTCLGEDDLGSKIDSDLEDEIALEGEENAMEDVDTQSIDRLTTDDENKKEGDDLQSVKEESHIPAAPLAAEVEAPDEDEELWEEDVSGLWGVRKRSQTQATDD